MFDKIRIIFSEIRQSYCFICLNTYARLIKINKIEKHYSLVKTNVSKYLRYRPKGPIKISNFY